MQENIYDIIKIRICYRHRSGQAVNCTVNRVAVDLKTNKKSGVLLWDSMCMYTIFRFRFICPVYTVWQSLYAISVTTFSTRCSVQAMFIFQRAKIHIFHRTRSVFIVLYIIIFIFCFVLSIYILNDSSSFRNRQDMIYICHIHHLLYFLY